MASYAQFIAANPAAAATMTMPPPPPKPDTFAQPLLPPPQEIAPPQAEALVAPPPQAAALAPPPPPQAVALAPPPQATDTPLALPPPQTTGEEGRDARSYLPPNPNRNMDAYEIANSADVYLAQLKRDTAVRNWARMDGELEKANLPFADVGVQAIGGLLSRGLVEKRREQRANEANYGMDPVKKMEIEALQAEDNRRQEESERREREIVERGESGVSGLSYKERLEQNKRKRQGLPPLQPDVAVSPVAIADPVYEVAPTPLPPPTPQPAVTVSPVMIADPAPAPPVLFDEGLLVSAKGAIAAYEGTRQQALLMPMRNALLDAALAIETAIDEGERDIGMASDVSAVIAEGVQGIGNTDSASNMLRLQAAYDVLKANEGDGKLGLKKGISESQLSHVSEVLSDMRAVIMEELDSPDPPVSQTVESVSTTTPTTSEPAAATTTTTTTSEGVSSFAQMLARAKAEETAREN